MGVGGGFWDELGPVKQDKGLEWLQGKRVAIDLSYWIVQQQSAVGNLARKPHLRNLFFRIVNLISRGGALPVVVVDGNPPREKLRVRMERFGRMFNPPIPLPFSQVDISADEPDIARNSAFQQSIDECVELLELLGIPVLRAKWEAEGLCAELNQEGWVDACVTPDSDAFLHGAKCVIKVLQLDAKDPLVETYTAEDIETTLGLQRQHMIALALLVGCDYDRKGVVGIGCSNAMRLIRSFPNEEILERLRGWGRGEYDASGLSTRICYDSESETELDDDENETCRKLNFEMFSSAGFESQKSPSHCSNCGHPGTKRDHAMYRCSACRMDENTVEAAEHGCVKKGKGFQCLCMACAKRKKLKKKTKHKDWLEKYCSKMASTDGFPKESIIDIFLRPGETNLAGDFGPATLMKWRMPNMDSLEDFLQIHLHWDTQFVRQHILPLLSTICLKGLASRNQHEPSMWNVYPFEDSILGRFVPHSIERIKVNHFKEFYMLRWQQLVSLEGNEIWLSPQKAPKTTTQQTTTTSPLGDPTTDGDHFGDDDHSNLDSDSLRTNGAPNLEKCNFTTVEDMKLVELACPELVEAFEQEQAVKEMTKAMKKGSKRKSLEHDRIQSQLSIKSFFKVKKGARSLSNHESAPIKKRAGMGSDRIDLAIDSSPTHSQGQAGDDGTAPAVLQNNPARPPVRRKLLF